MHSVRSRKPKAFADFSALGSTYLPSATEIVFHMEQSEQSWETGRALREEEPARGSHDVSLYDSPTSLARTGGREEQYVEG